MSMTYQNGKHYCIRNDVDDDIYVGSTTQLLCKRMVAHRAKVKSKPHYKLYVKMIELGIEHLYIELIENYPCDNKEELRKREGHYIRERETINTLIAGRTKTEWTNENKEHVKATQKQYYNDNKEEMQKQHKEYREEHKDEIKVWKKEHYETNKEDILAKQKVYYEENKDIVNKRSQDYRDNHKYELKEYFKEHRANHT